MTQAVSAISNKRRLSLRRIEGPAPMDELTVGDVDGDKAPPADSLTLEVAST